LRELQQLLFNEKLPIYSVTNKSLFLGDPQLSYWSVNKLQKKLSQQLTITLDDENQREKALETPRTY
jgi:hypothetical protein